SLTVVRLRCILRHTGVSSSGVVWHMCLDPSLRQLDIQIRKSRIINRIYKGIERHVSMAGRGEGPHQTLRESSAAGGSRGFAGVGPAVLLPGYLAQWSFRASGSAPPAIGPAYGESSATSADTGAPPPVPAAMPAHRASPGR